MLSLKRYSFNSGGLYDSQGNRNQSIANNVYESLKIMSGERCAICQQLYTEKNIITIEHLVPIGKNPKLKNKDDNLLGVCKNCNNGRKHKKEIICPTKIDTLEDDIFVAIDGEIKVNDKSLNKDILEDTIKSYRLNESKLKEKRKNYLKMLNNSLEWQIELIAQNKLDEKSILFPSIILQRLKDDENRKIEIKNKYYDRSTYAK